MKKILVYIFFIFFSFVERIYADNINDFQIEGLSVGDNVFDYFTSQTLNQRSVDVHAAYWELYGKVEAKVSTKKEKPKKLLEVSILDDRLEVYDELYVTYFRDTTIIKKVTGIKFFENKYEICKKEKDKIVNDISDLLDGTFQLSKSDKLREDEDEFLGSRQFSDALFQLDSGGSIQVVCEDYDEKRATIDSLLVTINSAGLNIANKEGSTKLKTATSSEDNKGFISVRPQQGEVETRPKF